MESHSLLFVAKRLCYCEGRQEREGCAKENQSETWRNLGALRSLGGRMRLSPQEL